MLNIFIDEMYIEIHPLPIEIVNNFSCESIDIAAIDRTMHDRDLTGYSVDPRTQYLT
jgi:hypothetical protein